MAQLTWRLGLLATLTAVVLSRASLAWVVSALACTGIAAVGLARPPAPGSLLPHKSTEAVVGAGLLLLGVVLYVWLPGASGLSQANEYAWPVLLAGATTLLLGGRASFLARRAFWFGLLAAPPVLSGIALMAHGLVVAHPALPAAWVGGGSLAPAGAVVGALGMHQARTDSRRSDSPVGAVVSPLRRLSASAPHRAMGRAVVVATVVALMAGIR